MSINHFRKFAGSSFFGLAVAVVLAGALSACSNSSFNSQSFKFGTILDDIFSNRPQMQDKVIVLIQFTNPPLLTSAQTQDGKKVVDQGLAKAIADEQAAGETALKNLSSNITILYRYKMVLNAFAVVAPINLVDKLGAIGGIAYVETEGSFSRPVILDTATSSAGVDIMTANSVKFIGADVAHQMKVKDKNGKDVPLDGTGMRVGIIDTGVDYTHAMFGGAGTADAYKAVDPSKSNPLFPTGKVIGGIDLVGTNYNAASANLNNHVPVPDANPIDEAGHGSHVAGTVAGKGDGINTYDGVAPGASLYAIKVFGAEGSTGDAAVIEGLEYAADPTGSGDPSQQLDAVNLSLGGPYGSPHILYQQAIGNLTKGGTVVLCAAGNEGALDYIVGAPSVANDAFSIAASIDNAPWNWQFPAVKFSSAGGDLLAQAMESPATKPLASIGTLIGSIVAVGIADKDFDAPTAASIKGKVALIDRGVVPFNDKIRRAQDAGAIAVIVDNNQAGDPFQMAAVGPFTIPAVMISQAMGDAVKAKLKLGDVTANLTVPDRIQKKELVDTITDFSSKGPRSQDSAIKPEVSAPGLNVVSVQMGAGNLGVQMSGTSMATPHMTGVMTILKQEHPDLSVPELKSLAMSTAKSISDAKGAEYPISVQGAGRIQLDKAVLAQAVSVPAAVSLGEQNLSSKKVVPYQITLKNISDKKITFDPSFRARAKGISLVGAKPVTLAAGESATVNLLFGLDITGTTDPVIELDGFLKFKTGGAVDMTLPVLAVIKRISNIKPQTLKVLASADDSAGAAVSLTLKNEGVNAGDALVFNLLGANVVRKSNPNHSDFVDTSCSLQAAGYRLISKSENGAPAKLFLQIVAKLYQAEDTWNMCEVSVLIDKDGKGIPNQELSGIALGNVPGLSDPTSAKKFASVLFDAALTRALRLKFEQDSQLPLDPKKGPPAENYGPAVEDLNNMLVVNHSTVAVIEAPVDDLATTDNGQLSIRVATINDNDAVQSDDFLEQAASQWTRISLQENSQAYVGMPESLTLNPGQEQTITMTKGFGNQDLLVVYPQNANVYSDLVKDGQASDLKPSFSN